MDQEVVNILVRRIEELQGQINSLTGGFNRKYHNATRCPDMVLRETLNYETLYCTTCKTKERPPFSTQCGLCRIGKHG